MNFLSSFFTTPLFLIGALAAAIPVVLHLIHKKRSPRIMFSTVRFLRISVERTAHRQRLQELLLLILRSLVLFLLAVALAGPFIPPHVLGGTSGNGATRIWGKGDTSAVLILDNSFSMATEHQGRTRYERARELARRALAGLGQGGSAAVIFTNGRGEADDSGAPASGLITNRKELLGQINTSKVSAGPGDLTAAILSAREILGGDKNPNREIYVFTDMQKLPWKSLTEAEKEDPAAEIPIIVVDCGDEGFRNLAVQRVQVNITGYARDAEIRVTATIHNSSEQPEKNVPVSVFLDGAKVHTTAVDVGARTANTIRPFALKLGKAETQIGRTESEAPETHVGWVEVEANDSLPFDNRRYFALELGRRIPVLVVKEAEAPVRVLDEAFYIMFALDPAVAGAEDAGSPMKPTAILRSALALKQTELSRYRVVFLMNLPALNQDEISALTRYLKSGGNLVFFLGDAVNLEAYNALAQENGILPARLSEAQGDPDNREEFQSLHHVESSHAVFIPFRGITRRFERVHCYRWFKLHVSQDSTGTVLASLANEDPFLVEKPVAQGRVLMFAVPATSRWSNFPVRRLFLPMIHQIIYYLTGHRSQKVDCVAGSIVPIRLPSRARPIDVEVTDPSGTTYPAAVDGNSDPQRQTPPAATDDSPRFATYARTQQIGVYTWRTSEGDEGVFVVNAHGDECNIARATREHVRMTMGVAKVYFAQNENETREVTDRLRKGLQLWNAVLFVVLVIALAECFLANRARESPTSQTPAAPSTA